MSLEPGGQLELGGAPNEDLHQTAAETRNHLDEVRDHSEYHRQCTSAWGTVCCAVVRGVRRITKRTLRRSVLLPAASAQIFMHINGRNDDLQNQCGVCWRQGVRADARDVCCQLRDGTVFEVRLSPLATPLCLVNVAA